MSMKSNEHFGHIRGRLIYMSPNTWGEGGGGEVGRQGVLLVVARVEPRHLGPPQCFCLEDFTKFCLFDSIEL